MPEPISIIGGALSAAGYTAKVGKETFDLVHGIRQAPENIKFLALDLRGLNGVLVQLNHILGQIQSQSIKDDMQVDMMNNITDLVENCAVVLTGTQKLIKPCVDDEGKVVVGFFKAVYYQTFKRSDIAQLRCELNHYKMTLNVACAFLQLYDSSQIQSMIRAVHASIRRRVPVEAQDISVQEAENQVPGQDSSGQNSVIADTDINRHNEPMRRFLARTESLISSRASQRSERGSIRSSICSQQALEVREYVPMQDSSKYGDKTSVQSQLPLVLSINVPFLSTNPINSPEETGQPSPTKMHASTNEACLPPLQSTDPTRVPDSRQKEDAKNSGPLLTRHKLNNRHKVVSNETNEIMSRNMSQSAADRSQRDFYNLHYFQRSTSASHLPLATSLEPSTQNPLESVTQSTPLLIQQGTIVAVSPASSDRTSQPARYSKPITVPKRRPKLTVDTRPHDVQDGFNSENAYRTHFDFGDNVPNRPQQRGASPLRRYRRTASYTTLPGSTSRKRRCPTPSLQVTDSDPNGSSNSDNRIISMSTPCSTIEASKISWKFDHHLSQDSIDLQYTSSIPLSSLLPSLSPSSACTGGSPETELLTPASAWMDQEGYPHSDMVRVNSSVGLNTPIILVHDGVGGTDIISLPEPFHSPTSCAQILAPIVREPSKIKQGHDRSTQPSSTQLCDSCQKWVLPDEGCVVDDHFWHFACLRCKLCSSVLQLESPFSLSENNELVCMSCTPSCRKCNLKMSDSPAFLAGKASYCHNCFSCNRCYKSLAEDGFSEISFGLLCTICDKGAAAVRTRALRTTFKQLGKPGKVG